MANEKMDLKLKIVQNQLESTTKYANNLCKNTMLDQDKRSALTVVARNLNDLILDARGVFFDAKKSKQASLFEKSKDALIDCVLLQNKVYKALIEIVEKTEPFLAFRFDGVIMANNNYIRRIREEKIEHIAEQFNV